MTISTGVDQSRSSGSLESASGDVGKVFRLAKKWRDGTPEQSSAPLMAASDSKQAEPSTALLQGGVVLEAVAVDAPMAADADRPILANRESAARRRRADTFEPLESWEGAVVEVFDSYFTALVHSRMSGSEEFAEIPTAEVSPADSDLLLEGARFYWTIGYHQAGSGQKSRQSILRFRRLARQRGESNRAALEWLQGVSDTWLNPS